MAPTTTEEVECAACERMVLRDDCEGVCVQRQTMEQEAIWVPVCVDCREDDIAAQEDAAERRAEARAEADWDRENDPF